MHDQVIPRNLEEDIVAKHKTDLERNVNKQKVKKSVY